MKKRIETYIKTWESRCYTNGIPDEVPSEIAKRNFAPSYKAIAIAILSNDHALQSLGFTPKKSVYYGILKRIEISKRSKT